MVRGVHLAFAAFCAMAVIGVASAAGSARGIKAVPTAARIEFEGRRLIPYGRSRLLVVQPSFGSEPGSLTRIDLDGSVDASFGDDGTVALDGSGVAVTADGKILVATSKKVEGSAGRTDARVTRLLADGKVDRSFGRRGSADVHFGRRLDYGEAVSVAPDGDVLLAGIRVDYADNYGGAYTLAVARFKPDGKLDRSFGTQGVSTLFSHREEEVAFEIASTPTGGVVVVGGNELHVSVWELNRNGSTRRHFGYGGIAEMPLDRKVDGHEETVLFLPGMAVARGGALLLVAAGSASGRVVVARLRADGRIDRSFGHRGWAVVNRASPEGFTLLPGGDLAVAASFAGKAAKRRPFGAVALTPDGRLDRRFGQDGRCRGSVGEPASAAGAAFVGGHLILGGAGMRKSWLLDCPVPRGR